MGDVTDRLEAAAKGQAHAWLTDAAGRTYWERIAFNAMGQGLSAHDAADLADAALYEWRKRWDQDGARHDLNDANGWTVEPPK